MLLYLIGLPGAGKTATGRKLAKEKHYPFIDLDAYIEEKEKKTIKNIFGSEGEDSFRRLENKYLKEVATLPEAVIATGGGTPCFYDNIHVIKQTGKSVFLNPSLAHIAQRIAQQEAIRPMFQTRDEKVILAKLEQLYLAREPFYLKADLITITTDLHKLVKQILSYF
ncbi:MAG: shikimate kinase [Thermonemataceae bacterium]